MPYTFDFLNSSGDIDHFDIIHCQDDEEARSLARMALNSSTHAVRVMVWDAKRPLGVVERADAPTVNLVTLNRACPHL